MKTTPAAEAARQHTLDLIERAQTLLYQAARAACPIVPWADQWDDIGNHADATKALWHRINGAPMPERMDSEPREAGPVSVPPSSNPKASRDLEVKTADFCEMMGFDEAAKEHFDRADAYDAQIPRKRGKTPMDLKSSTGREG